MEWSDYIELHASSTARIPVCSVVTENLSRQNPSLILEKNQIIDLNLMSPDKAYRLQPLSHQRFPTVFPTNIFRSTDFFESISLVPRIHTSKCSTRFAARSYVLLFNQQDATTSYILIVSFHSLIMRGIHSDFLLP